MGSNLLSWIRWVHVDLIQTCRKNLNCLLWHLIKHYHVHVYLPWYWLSSLSKGHCVQQNKTTHMANKSRFLIFQWKQKKNKISKVNNDISAMFLLANVKGITTSCLNSNLERNSDKIASRQWKKSKCKRSIISPLKRHIYHHCKPPCRRKHDLGRFNSQTLS